MAVFVLATVVSAQQPRPADTTDVEVDPITCWWKATSSAVRTGEPFGLMLTCAVVETESMKVAPDFSKLDPTVVQLPPFELLGGSHPGDLTSPGKRFFQYEYRLRAIPEEGFGADLALPPLEITYRIESKVASGDSVQGRDQTYLLPRTSVRLISLVPDDAADIREAPAAGFLSIETRASRANIYQTVATLLFGLAGLIAAVIVVSLLRSKSAKTAKSRALRSNRAIIAAANRELEEVRRDSRGGWTPELAARALSPLRLVGAFAAGHPIGQRSMEGEAGPMVGQLAISRGFGRPGALVSGSITTESVGVETPATRGLADALRTLTVACYGRANSAGTADEALDTAIRIGREQAAAHSLPSEWSRAAGQALVNARRRVWA
jgi:hypothetical protein